MVESDTAQCWAQNLPYMKKITKIADLLRHRHTIQYDILSSQLPFCIVYTWSSMPKLVIYVIPLCSCQCYPAQMDIYVFPISHHQSYWYCWWFLFDWLAIILYEDNSRCQHFVNSQILIWWLLLSKSYLVFFHCSPFFLKLLAPAYITKLYVCI